LAGGPLLLQLLAAHVQAFRFRWGGHDVFLEHRRRYTLTQVGHQQEGATPISAGRIGSWGRAERQDIGRRIFRQGNLLNARGPRDPAGSATMLGPFNPAGTLLRRHLAQFVSAVDIWLN
jgi:hypothetical protein